MRGMVIVLLEFFPFFVLGGRGRGEQRLAPRGHSRAALRCGPIEDGGGVPGRDGRGLGGARIVDAELRYGVREAGGLARHARGRGGPLLDERGVHLPPAVPLRDWLLDLL